MRISWSNNSFSSKIMRSSLSVMSTSLFRVAPQVAADDAAPSFEKNPPVAAVDWAQANQLPLAIVAGCHEAAHEPAVIPAAWKPKLARSKGGTAAAVRPTPPTKATFLQGTFPLRPFNFFPGKGTDLLIHELEMQDVFHQHLICHGSRIGSHGIAADSWQTGRKTKHALIWEKSSFPVDGSHDLRTGPLELERSSTKRGSFGEAWRLWWWDCKSGSPIWELLLLRVLGKESSVMWSTSGRKCCFAIAEQSHVGSRDAMIFKMSKLSIYRFASLHVPHHPRIFTSAYISQYKKMLQRSIYLQHSSTSSTSSTSHSNGDPPLNN